MTTRAKKELLFLDRIAKKYYNWDFEVVLLWLEDSMQILFVDNKLKKAFDSARNLKRKFGSHRADKIEQRLSLLRIVPSLSMVPKTPPERMHKLSGSLNAQFAVDISRNFRMVFTPAQEPLPRREDGGIDLEQVTSVVILEIVDYH